MEDALAKIRPHTTSNLPHQKTPANLLLAIESTLQEQKTEPSPTAYFAALITTVDGTIQRREVGLGEADILPAELYLLALVAPFVAPSIIRANLDTLVSLTSPLFPVLIQHAPPLKSQLSLYQAIFVSLEKSQIEIQGIRQSFASILQLCVDPRPKVRKKAVDVVRSILAAPPAPLLRHPYADRVSVWLKSSLEEHSTNPLSRNQSKKSDGAEIAIHLVAFLKQVVKFLPPQGFPDIIDLLLRLPRLGNPFLSQATYISLAELLDLGEDDDFSLTADIIRPVLETILSSAPSKHETNMSAPWVTVVAYAFLAYSRIDTDSSMSMAGTVWKAVWPFLESSDSSTRKATVDSLGLISSSFTSGLIQEVVMNEKSSVSQLADQVQRGLDSLPLAQYIPDVLAVITHLTTNLESKNHDVAESLLLPLIEQVGSLRTKKGFEHKESVDLVLASAMRAFGPHTLLQVLPLNLEPSDRESGREPRAFMLPLLSQPHPSPLSHFVEYFVPLSETMFNLEQKAEVEGRKSEGKVWSVLTAQVWAGFPSYCYGRDDLEKAITPQFSQLLSQLLYGQPDLRPAVLKGLKNLVESNSALQSLNAQDRPHNAISSQKAAQNITFLQSQAESWLAVLFNVFSSVGRDSRTMVGDVVTAWASITRQEDIQKAYLKVLNILKNSLAKDTSRPNSDDNNVTMAQDLLFLLIPYLSGEDSQKLFSFVFGSQILTSKDNGIQKRGYKILAKLLEKKLFELDIAITFQKLDELAEGLLPAAKRDRFALFTSLVPSIPSNDLHLIVSLIPETVLGTKEPSDKTRSAAFNLLLTMGKRMQSGGVVKRAEIDGMDEDGAESNANVEEFMTMIAGGLAGASPHMISGTVTAISRLVYEYRDELSPKMQEEIFTTHLVFLTSANREIVKSVLGFIKLSIHTLPTSMIRPHLPELVRALLGWSHDHKNHFKVKVRHIFERMLRRFSWEEVNSCAGNDDAAKVLLNIKKRKERAKRKKAARDDGDDGEGDEPRRAAAGDAFEDVVYGSESELEDSDDDENPGASAPRADRGRSQTGPRLRLAGEDPVDLLHGVSSQITSGKNERRRKPGQDASHFRSEEDTGRMIIDEQDPDAEESPNGDQLEGMAYKEALTSADGFTRGQRGVVKFNKDTKKRRRQNEEQDADIDMADAEAVKTKPTQQNKQRKIGNEFKAKRAGGDLKKAGVDPYAYVSLTQAAKKSGKKNRIGVAKR